MVIIENLVLFGLFIAFSLSSWAELKKYLEDDTMRSIYDETDYDLKMPVITICANPPFKNDDFFATSNAFNAFPMGEELIDSYDKKWKDSNYFANLTSFDMLINYLTVNKTEFPMSNSFYMGACIHIKTNKTYQEKEQFTIGIAFKGIDFPSSIMIWAHPENDL